MASSGTTPEAQRYYDKAMAFECQTAEDFRQRAIYLTLAIEAAKGYYPAAHARLGACLIHTGDNKQARREFQLAVEQQSHNALARMGIVLVDMANLGTSNFGRGGGIGDIIPVLGEAITEKAKVMAWSKKIDELVQAYPEDLLNSGDPGYWISISEAMLKLHDQVQHIPGVPGKQRLAQAVVDAPWDRAQFSGDWKGKAQDLRDQARGRILLAERRRL